MVTITAAGIGVMVVRAAVDTASRTTVRKERAAASITATATDRSSAERLTVLGAVVTTVVLIQVRTDLNNLGSVTQRPQIKSVLYIT